MHRTAIEQMINNKNSNSLKNGPFIMDKNVYSEDIESDVSERHDGYIYEKRRGRRDALISPCVK